VGRSLLTGGGLLGADGLLAGDALLTGTGAGLMTGGWGLLPKPPNKFSKKDSTSELA